VLVLFVQPVVHNLQTSVHQRLQLSDSQHICTWGGQCTGGRLAASRLTSIESLLRSVRFCWPRVSNDMTMRVLSNAVRLSFAAAVLAVAAGASEATLMMHTLEHGSVRGSVEVLRGVTSTWTVESSAVTAVVSDACVLRSVGGRASGTELIEVGTHARSLSCHCVELHACMRTRYAQSLSCSGAVLPLHALYVCSKSLSHCVELHALYAYAQSLSCSGAVLPLHALYVCSKSLSHCVELHALYAYAQSLSCSGAVLPLHALYVCSKSLSHCVELHALYAYARSLSCSGAVLPLHALYVCSKSLSHCVELHALYAYAQSLSCSGVVLPLHALYVYVARTLLFQSRWVHTLLQSFMQWCGIATACTVCVRCTYVALPIEVGAHALTVFHAVVWYGHCMHCMCTLHVRCSSDRGGCTRSYSLSCSVVVLPLHVLYVYVARTLLFQSRWVHTLLQSFMQWCGIATACTVCVRCTYVALPIEVGAHALIVFHAVV
jgi:hypothetical protein